MFQFKTVVGIDGIEIAFSQEKYFFLLLYRRVYVTSIIVSSYLWKFELVSLIDSYRLNTVELTRIVIARCCNSFSNVWSIGWLINVFMLSINLLTLSLSGSDFNPINSCLSLNDFSFGKLWFSDWMVWTFCKCSALHSPMVFGTLKRLWKLKNYQKHFRLFSLTEHASFRGTFPLTKIESSWQWLRVQSICHEFLTLMCPLEISA